MTMEIEIKRQPVERCKDCVNLFGVSGHREGICLDGMVDGFFDPYKSFAEIKPEFGDKPCPGGNNIEWVREIGRELTNSKDTVRWV